MKPKINVPHKSPVIQQTQICKHRNSTSLKTKACSYKTFTILVTAAVAEHEDILFGYTVLKLRENLQVEEREN